MNSDIPVQHQAALKSAVQAHNMEARTNLTAVLKLYSVAADGIAGKPMLVDSPHIYGSVLAGEAGTISTATDKGTGVFVQLSRVGSKSSVMLTVGQKWASESHMNHASSSVLTYW